MNLKLRTLSVGVLFFAADAVMAQRTKPTNTQEAKDIEEVVVIGYQKKKAEKVTSAVVQVSSESLQKMAPTTTATNMLQGKMAGVDITAFSGKPGSGANINIRGLGNIGTSPGASSPLIVLDGNILGNDTNAQFLFNAIPPGDIESVSTLKDAAAAAIYGSQGANGVIVVTTKSGKSGRPIISYTSRLGMAEKPEDINYKMMNAAQKLQYENELAALKVEGYTLRTQKEIDDLVANNHDWQRDILRTSFIQNHNLALRAGTDKIKYSASLTYDSDNGIIQHLDAFKRIGGRFKLDATPTEKLNLGFNFGTTWRKTQEQRDRNNDQNPIKAMYMYNPYETVFLPSGAYNPTSQDFAILNALQREPSISENVIVDLGIYGEYKLSPDFSYKLQGTGIYNAGQSDKRTLLGSELHRLLRSNSSGKTLSNTFNYTLTNTLNYNKQIGKHNIDVLALAELRENLFSTVGLSGRDFSSPVNSEISNTSTPFSTSGYSQKYMNFGYGAFATYDYDSRYLLTASIRRDADSRFGKNNVWSQPFWSVSAAWNLGREPFLENTSINDLKLRASYGLRGFNNIPLFINQITLRGGSYGDNPVNPTLYPQDTHGNDNLKWEVTKTTNLGIEYSLFKRRLTGTVDYFIDKKENFIFPISNAGVIGGSYDTYINAGAMENKGWELSANLDILKSSRGLNWSVRGNITLMNYNLEKLNDGETELIQSINILRPNHTPFEFYLVRSGGINRQNGREIFIRKDGTMTEEYYSADRVGLDGKSPLPKGYGGFGTTFSYRNFDLSADFYFKYGNYIYNYMAWNGLDYTNGGLYNMRADAIDYWTPNNVNASLPAPAPTANGQKGLQITDRFLQDGSFLRFRNLSLGYTFTKANFGNDMPVNRVRLSLTGQNLMTWTRFEGDPEVSVGSGESQLGAGQTFISGAYALYSYPQLRSFLFGIDVEF